MFSRGRWAAAEAAGSPERDKPGSQHDLHSTAG